MADAQRLADGSRFGNFTVTRLLGRGGMGEVYLAEDPVAAEFYAVKVVPDPSDEARFIREAEAATRLRHPNLVTVYDAGKDPETGFCYLTMEYMPRGSLREAIEADGPLALTKVASVAADVAAALAVIEANGMVHRDVKPGNILLAADGTAKLTDLGISRDTGAAATDARTTQVGDVVGTPAYMAPEQMLDSRAVDIRADLYALGVVMYEMLTGRRPNEGESAMTTLARALEGHPPPDVRAVRRDCPAPLAALVAALMAPDPSARPADARSVLWLLAHPERIRVADGDAHPPCYSDRATLYALVALVFSLEALVVAVATVLTRV